MAKQQPVTLESLADRLEQFAGQVTDRFERLERKIDAKINTAVKQFDKKIDTAVQRLDAKIDEKIDEAVSTLAASTQRGFTEVHERINEVNERIDAGTAQHSEEHRQMKAQIADLGFKQTELVRRDEFHKLNDRVETLEAARR